MSMNRTEAIEFLIARASEHVDEYWNQDGQRKLDEAIALVRADRPAPTETVSQGAPCDCGAKQDTNWGGETPEALADVRTLDEWADRFSRVHALHRVNGTGWACTLTAPLREELQFFGATPDAARAAAAAWVRGQAK